MDGWQVDELSWHSAKPCCSKSCNQCQHLFPAVIALVIIIVNTCSPSVITLVIITVNTCSLLSSLLSSSLLSFLCHLVKDYLVASSSKIYVYVKGHICTYKWTFHEVTQSYACEICPVGNNPHKASFRFRAFMSWCDGQTLCFVLLSRGRPGRPPARICC